ncbi:glutamine synthetase [Actinokineospora alba]|uniref:Glutamine synthetase n=1 Tax=Actinokineospora alba TaxID=504798 RepID=A0A1H0TZ88_9PSEU|nr:glutamine synthetase [Actinokineospora alba]TDP70806.1 glutamine synthetase [Actinokineospora alba]SDJ16963.1 glutamine synthetase [Actinokineospora alba]SDP59221.1 glutamine synthetase [Actinokineospora alba]
MTIQHQRPVGPRTLADRALAASSLSGALRAAVASGDVRRVVCLVPDPHARFAAVEVGAEFFVDTVMPSGYGMVAHVFGWNPERDPVNASAVDPFLGGYGDLTLRPDLATLAPAGPGAWFVVCDVEWPDGRPVAEAPRTLLREHIAAAEKLGFVPSVGIEHEVTFTTADGTPITDRRVDYAVDGLSPMRDVLADVHAAIDRLDLGAESARGEAHPGQYEIVLRARDALAACDDAMLHQLAIRQAAAARGVRAGYLAAESAGTASSCHVHLALADAAGMSMVAGAQPTEPSTVFGHFLAGILRAAGDLTAFWAPTWNSYVRLRTAPFSPRTLRWGTDDRTAAVRLVGRGPSLRMEARFAGADAQPHLVVAALLAAGLSGIEERLPLPAEGRVVGDLARTPWDALTRLTESKLARALLGDAAVDHRAALLGEELNTGLDSVTDWQRARGDLRA